MEKYEEKHFVLVHGACHGAWSWYKVATLLTTAGHRVTAVDLAASGVHPSQLDEINTFADYSQPLIETMASLPQDHKVILVGHSLGGLSLALAMDRFPEKVSVAVFLSAFMPDSSSRPSHVVEKYFEKVGLENFLDTQFTFDQGQELYAKKMLFGHRFLAEKLYQLCPPEDLTLAKSLVRTGCLFMKDLSKAPIFSKERYGTTPRVYIVCSEDLGIPKDFQHWMVQNYPPQDVKEIKGADHMPLFSKPQELVHNLLDIAAIYP